MQNKNNPNCHPNESHENNNRAARPWLWWIIIGGLLVVVALAAVSYFHPNMTERFKFFAATAMNALILTAILAQAYIYTKQWEAMRKGLERSDKMIEKMEDQSKAVNAQVGIMRDQLEFEREKLARVISPRLRIAEVKAEGWEFGQIPAFIISIVNEGATDARDVAIQLQAQSGTGDGSVVQWSREQVVTIPANGKEDYFVRWASILGQEALDGFNDAVPLRMFGYFKHGDDRRIDFCYRYYPWPFGKRPKGLPQFVPCDFDPGLTIVMKVEAGIFKISGQMIGTTIRAAPKEEGDKKAN